MAVPQELFVNDTATGTLASDPTTGTTLTLTTGHGARFPTVTSGSHYLRLRIESELILVTAHAAASDTMTVTRGIEGTTNAAHAAGTTVDSRLTADALERWIPDYVPQPRHWGMVAWSTQPPLWISTGTALTAGTVYVMRAFVPETIVFANMITAIATAGVTGTATWWMGVYDSAGTLLGKTADQGANTTSAGIKGPYALTVEGGQSLTVAGVPGSFVYLATLCGTQNSGTPFALTATAGNNTGRPNVNLTTSLLMAGVAATSQSALPSTITPGSITLSAQMGIAAT